VFASPNLDNGDRSQRLHPPASAPVRPQRATRGATRLKPQTDPDLEVLIDAWPSLPEALRSGIAAMVRASVGK
jgi:hypothetical protein